MVIFNFIKTINILLLDGIWHIIAKLTSDI